MKSGHYITAAEFCAGHNIEMTFLYSLDETGLIHLEKAGESVYILMEQLPDLERIIRLHFDLGINLEGIDTVINLLDRTETLQNEINMLKNRLRLYEDI